MSTEYSISVVIPAYNAEAYLEDTLKSVYAQTHLPLEVIVVDDGSSDGTAAIAKQYPVQLIQQQNQGICTARNVGIRASRGAWIALLDNDDLWVPTKLEEQVRFLQQFPDIGMVVSDFTLFEEQNHTSSFEVTPDVHRFQREAQSDLYSILWSVPAEALHWFFVFMPSMWLVRKDILQTVGMFWDGLQGGEDWELFFRIIAKYPIGVIERPLMHYRVRRTSQSRKAIAMMTGKARVLQAVMQNPERFPAGMNEVAAGLLPETLAARGYAEYHAGLSQQARASFRESLKRAFQPKIMVRWLLTWLPLSYYRQLSTRFHQMHTLLQRIKLRLT